MDGIERLSSFTLVASDQAYDATPGSLLGAYPDSFGVPGDLYPASMPARFYDAVRVGLSEWQVLNRIDDPESGFGATFYIRQRDGKTDYMAAMQGTRGPNPQDWGGNLQMAIRPTHTHNVMCERAAHGVVNAAERAFRRCARIAAILSSLAVTPTAFAGVSPVGVPGGYYFTKDIVEGRTQEQRGIVWLDNDRIMFKGHLLTQDRRKRDPGIYVWNIDRGDVMRYGEESNFCYSAGTLFVWDVSVWARSALGVESKAFTQRYRYGSFGKEKPGVCRSDGQGRTEGCVGRVDMSCKPRAYPDGLSPLGPDSKILIYLRSGDGVIVANPSIDRLVFKNLSRDELIALSRKPVVLVNERQLKGKPLPIQEVEQVGSGFAVYSEYKQRYVLVGAIPRNGPPNNYNNWPAGMPQPIYMMSREGDVEVIQVPKLPDWVAIHQAMPSQRGLVYWGSHGRTGGGLFIFDGTHNEALDRGQVRAFAISPDGCKAAYAIINDYNVGPSLDYKIKYLNVCQGG